MGRRRAATGTRRTTISRRDGDSGDHLDQLLDDRDDQDDDADHDDADQDDTDDRDDQDDDADDDPDQGDRDNNQDDRAGRRRKRERRSRDDDTDDDRDRPITVDDLEKAAQRIADRQVNALLRRIDRGKAGGRDQPEPDDRGGGRRRRDDRTRDRDEGDDRDTSRRDEERRAYDQREARLAFRDYFGGDGRNLSTTERELGNTLARVEISTRLDEHGDPDRAGREAAERVGDQLTEFRRLVEKQTVAALRKRGALRERGSNSSDDDQDTDSGNAGGSQPPGRAPAPAKLADKRQAAKSFAADYNTRLGHTPTTTDAGSRTG